MSIRVDHVDDVAVVCPRGVLTGEPDDDGLQQVLDELIDSGKKKILVDLEHTPFMTSRAFGVLIATHTRAQKLRVTLYTCSMQERVQKVVQIIRVKGWPQLFATRQDALQAFEKQPNER